MKSRGMSGRAKRPVKEARGKLKNSNKLIMEYEVIERRMNRLPNCNKMKPSLTENSECGRNEKSLITTAIKGG